MRAAFLSLLIVGLTVLPSNAHATSRILMYGDSLISGYNLGAQESVPMQLHNALIAKSYDVRVINEGVAGETTTGGKARLNWSLDRKSPHIVVLALGGNDMLRGISTDIIRQNLEAMLIELRKRQIKTLLVRVTAPPNYDAGYAEALSNVYSDLGLKYSVPVYPFLLEPIFGNTDYMQQDGIHPNAAGTKYIATYLADYLISTGWIEDKKR